MFINVLIKRTSKAATVIWFRIIDNIIIIIVVVVVIVFATTLTIVL